MSCEDAEGSSGAKSFPEVRRKLRRSLSESSIILKEGRASHSSQRHNTSFSDDNNNSSSSNGNAETANLYAKVRQQLHKVHRISKTGLTAPKTPSKPGVYVETNIGKFSQIKALFDRRCRGAAGAAGGKNSVVAGARDNIRMANSFVRRLASSINSSSTTKPRRLYNSDSDSPDRVTFNKKKGMVKLEQSIIESPARRNE